MSRQFKPGQLKPGLLYDITASRALTASYALNSAESYRIVSGSVTASVNTRENIFLIQSASRQLFAVSSSGVVVVATQSAELTNPAPYGGMYFTSGSFFIGLE